jgi:chemotaxis family two-component system sensor kinase Cph1
LKNSNKELEQFAYVASHDLREPLRMITSFLQLLKRRYVDTLDKDANEFIDYAVDGAQRMDVMIKDLLDYSRIGCKELKFEYLKSEEILKTAIINLNSSIEENNAIITYDHLPLIYANGLQMVQLFQNLIGNAIKYRGEEDPEIHISIKEVNDEYIFSIKDNGIGIDQKHLNRYLRFFTVYTQKTNMKEQELVWLSPKKYYKNIVEKFGLNRNLEKEQHSISHYQIKNIKNFLK